MADQNPNKKPTDKQDDSGNKGQGSGGQKPPQNFISRSAMGWILIGGLAVLLFILMNSTNGSSEEIAWSKFYNFAKSGQFDVTKPIVLKNSRVEGTLVEGATGTDASAEGPIKVYAQISPHGYEPVQAKLDQLADEGKIELKFDPQESLLIPLLMTYGPILLLVLLAYFFIFRGLRNAGGGAGMLGSFGRSRHRVTNKEHSNITLSDVAGIDEAKDEVTEIIEFLKNPKKFQRLGGRVPRGVLLIGQPGCGKTLLAKAVAGEADVPFFSISGSDFVEMFVGVGASRVRDLFKQARENSPCIIFLDEIDAVGRRRGSGFSSGGHDEREQTLNAILVEMDGFESDDQIIVMAATNRADVLDPALTRPGRFDRQIQVPLPDIRGRAQILTVHAKKIKTGPNVDLEKLARSTPMFSGADLAAIINEAAIAATLQAKSFVEQDDLEEARDKVKWGRARRSHKVEEEEKVATAYHEAGHAVAQYLLEHADPLHKVTIIPRGQAMGATFSLPEKDRHGYGLRYLRDTMRVLCGGRIAEEKKTSDVSSGAAMDIRMATAYARHMVLEWGMSEKLGFVDLQSPDNPNSMMPERAYSEETGRVVDQEIKRIIDEAYNDARKLLEDNWDKVVALGEALLKYETLGFDEVDRLMKGEPLDKPTVGDLLKMEADKAREKSAAPESDAQTEDAADDAPGTVPSPA